MPDEQRDNGPGADDLTARDWAGRGRPSPVPDIADGGTEAVQPVNNSDGPGYRHDVGESTPFWRSAGWFDEPLSDDVGDGSPRAAIAEDVPDVIDSDGRDPGPDPGVPGVDLPGSAPAEGEYTDPGPSWGAASPDIDGWPDEVKWDSDSYNWEPDDTTTAGADAPGGQGEWAAELDDSTGTWGAYQQELENQSAETHERQRRPDVATTAVEFAAQRTATSLDEPPTQGLPGLMYRVSGGLVRMQPVRDERARRERINEIRRNIVGLRQITFTNPKGGSGKTTAALLTSTTLGRVRGGYILAWDNNETQGTLGVRARPDEHANTVRDLIADLPTFSGPVAGRVGDLAKYIRSQGDAMFDVLASDEQATAGEMMTAAAFQAVREVVGRFYKIICVDTGNNVRAANWAAAIDATDQLVVTSSVRWESAYSASRMLDYLEQSGRGDLVANAVTVLTMPRSMKGLNLPQVETHFKVRTREVLHAPFDPQLDNGDEIRYSTLSDATREAWLEISAAIVRGL